MSHIVVERKKRRRMNEHLKVLRSLTPCFYIKRGDQASIIGGVIEFIKELCQVLQALESKKRRKSLAPALVPVQALQGHFLTTVQLDSPFGVGAERSFKELVASCNSSIADVEVKISGPKVILKVISHRILGQVAKIITVLERLSFEVLDLNISSLEDTVLYHFVVKIGLEYQLSLEELAMEVQKSFCPDAVSAIEI